MRLAKLDVENFRRIEKASVHLSPSTFIIGPNNTAKSSLIAAIEALLSLERERLTQMDILERSDGTRATEAVITAHFGDIPTDVAASRGFKGRVVNGEFVYRKTLTAESTKPKIETREYPSELKPAFAKAKKVKDLMDGGITVETLKDALGTEDPEEKLSKEWHKTLPEAVDFDTAAEPTWVPNPRGHSSERPLAVTSTHPHSRTYRIQGD